MLVHGCYIFARCVAVLVVTYLHCVLQCWLLHICTACCSAGCYIFALRVAPVHAHALVCLVLPLVSAVVVAVGAALFRHMHKMSHKTTQSQPRVAYKVFVCFIFTGQRLAELCGEQQLLVTEAAASFNAEKQC